MADQENKNDLDELLDSLLATYADAQPRPGLRTRVLASLRASSKPYRGARIWLWAGAATATLALAVLAAYFSRVAPLPQPPVIERARTVTLPSNDAVSSHETYRRSRRNPAPQEPAAVIEVRQEVFPTRTPLSDQEKLLLRYLAGTPQEEVAAHAQADPPPETVEPVRPESRQLVGTGAYSTQ